MADWDGLRHELEGSVTPPPLDRLRERRRHRQQRRTIAVATTIALVGIASGVALLGRAAERANQEAAAPPPEVTRVVNGDRLPPPRDYEQHVVTDVDFVTPETGFAIGLRCVGDLCDVATWRTGDGGRTWSAPVALRSGVPRVSFTEEDPAGGGARSLRMVDAFVGYAFNPDLYLTTDGGLTWERQRRTGKVTSVSVAGDSVWVAERGCARDVDCDLVVGKATVGLGAPRGFSVPATEGALALLRRADAKRAFLLTWAAPDPADNALHRTLDGRTWQRATHPCRDASAALLNAGPDRPLWVVCTTPAGRRVHLSADDGRTWTAAGALPADGEVTDLLAYSANDAYVALQNPGRLLVTSDAGRTWRPADGTGKAYGYANVDVVDPAHVFAMGDAGHLWRTTDGRRWERLALPPRAPAAPPPVSDSFRAPREENVTARNLWFLDRRRGWAVAERCTQPSGGTCSPVLRRTADGGVTWEAVPGPAATWVPRPDMMTPQPRALTGIVFVDDRTGFVFGGDVHLTTDAGATWRKLDFGGRYVAGVQVRGDTYWAVSYVQCQWSLCDPRFHRGRVGEEPRTLSGYEVADASGAWWAVDADTMYWADPYHASDRYRPMLTATTDGGATWQRHPVPCPGYQERTITSPEPGRLWALCANARRGRGPDLVARSDDGGRTWRTAAVPTAETPRGLRMLNADFGWFQAFSDSVYVTRDGAATWERMQVPPEFRRVTFVDPEHGWLLDLTTLYRTTDGRHWERLGEL